MLKRFFSIACQNLAWSFLCLCLFGLVSAKTYADQKEYYDSWEFKYSDKTRLIWYYNTRADREANQPNTTVVNGKEFLVLPKVRPPTINGVYLLEFSKINEGEDVLDLGTGTGIHAIFAAEKARHIVATDIYESAVENARQNAKIHNVEDKIDFRVGDLFSPIKEGEKFDVVFININFPFAVEDKSRKALHERFFSSVKKFLKPKARIYFQTSFVANVPYIYDMLMRNQLYIKELHMEHLLPSHHEPVFMRIQAQ